MTQEQCSDLEVLAESLGVTFSSLESPAGIRVYLGEERRAFDRYSDGVLYLTPIDPDLVDFENRKRPLLGTAACYLELGRPQEAIRVLDELPTAQQDDPEVRDLRLEILMAQGRWDLAYDCALAAASPGRLG